MFANQYILITQHQIVPNISLTVTLDMIIFHPFPGSNIFRAMTTFLNNFLPARTFIVPLSNVSTPFLKSNDNFWHFLE